MALTRFGVSLPAELLTRFDLVITAKGYSNRSEALRDLIRAYLVGEEIEADAEVVGTLTLIYDHHVPGLDLKMKDLQHDYYQSILSNLHFHLDHDNCLEIVVLRGRYSLIRKIADHLIGLRGVKHGQLAFTSTGKNLPGY